MRHLLRCAALLIMLAVMTDISFSYPGGRAGTTLKSGTAGCGSCHGSTPTLTVLSVVAGPAQLYAGETGTYTLTITGGTGAGSGCNVAANVGVLAPVSAFIQMSGAELVQTTSTAYTSGSVIYRFTYTAPKTAGSDTIYATGYSSNRTQSSGLWNWAPKFAVQINAAVQPPAAPELAFPANAAVDVPATSIFRWNRSPGAMNYRLQVASDNGFTSIAVNDSAVTDTQRVVRYLSASTKYYWRVRAANDIGLGDWSASWEFTVSATTPLSGRKTVGGTSPDYSSLKSALRDLKARGTTPPGVTFALSTGTYAEDSLLVQTITSSSTAPITIMPDAGATVVISSATDSAVIRIEATSYVTIDGSNNGTSSRDLSILGTASPVLKGIWLSGPSTYCVVKNCIVRPGAATGATYRCIDLLYTAAGNPNYALIENNRVRFGYTGVRAQGKSAGDSLTGIVVRRNIADSIGNAGFYASSIANALIHNNDLSVQLGSSASMYGIFVGSNSDNVRIFANKVHDMNQLSASSTTAGIYVSVGTAAHGSTMIYNNFVWLSPTTTGTGIIYGIVIHESNDYRSDTLAFNTVVLSGSGAGNRQSVAIYKAAVAGLAGVVMKNNIAINTRTEGTTGAATAIGKYKSSTTYAAVSSDNNNLYVGATDAQHAIGRVGATSPVLYATMADWRALHRGDSVSFSENTPFVSAVDLHIPAGTTTLVESSGIPMPGISTDIDGDPRDPLKPDLGADEFNGVVSGADAPAAIPVNVELWQNYPNPFNPVTTISYQLAGRSHVSLQLYDLLGRVVATLVDGVQTPGIHTATWNASAFTSGIYFYTLRTENSLKTRSMILLK